MKNYAFVRPLFAFALLAAFACQGTWALAGTTGGLRGAVVDDRGAPVAGADVKVSSASQVASATTDATGHFTFLALAPDTYTVSIQKQEYEPISYAGVSVFADNVDTLSFTMTKLKTIGSVTAKATGGGIVKRGVGQDVYSADASVIAKSTALGGGANLDNAYSTVAAQPGVQVPIGGIGWNQPVYVRGSQSFFTGYEYDGIPVNRAFDNYNSSTESNLGLQELQVYTGGGPASNSSAGTAGFINQVIRTGTYPGFGNLEGGLGAVAFYHKLKVEGGGATPDRRFSYYVGLSGTNQAFRAIDNNNAAAYDGPGGIFTTYFNSAVLTGAGANQNFTGVQALCSPTELSANGGGPAGSAPTCLMPVTALFATPAFITDRENIANFHFAIPRKNGLRDDLQLLWSASSLNTSFYSSANDLGSNVTGDPNCPTCTYGQNVYSVVQTGATGQPGLTYANASVYNVPFGTNITGVTPQTYLQPSTTAASQGNGFIPSSYRDGIYNDTGIVKAQYTHALSDRAYVRLFGYTFFSDWTQAGAITAATGEALFTAVSPNYDLITHTAGGELQFADQINDKNLLQLTGNYTTAHVTRFNNTGFLGGTSPVGVISQDASGNYTCYSPGGMRFDSNTGLYDVPAPAAGSVIPCYNATNNHYNTNSAHPYGCAGVLASPTPGCHPYSTPQSANGTYASLWDGNASGTFNTVQPNFSFVSLTDEFRPNDRWLIDLGLRYEDYTYNLTNSNTPANNFYAQVVSNYTCYAPGQGVATAPLPPGSAPPAPVLYINGDCNTGLTAAGYTIPSGVTFVHPNFTAQSPNAYDQHFYSLRVSGTYTESPDTVWRASAGRFTEPPISASVQYLNRSGNAQSLWANFESLGFFSPFHAVPTMSSSQIDLSLERHIRGTDVSFKLSPFYNYTRGYQGQAFIGTGFVSQVPIGNFRSYGAEFALTKGDFNKDGLSGQFSLTYNNAKMQYQSQFGGALPNNINGVNAAINSFNELTKARGGSPCYTPSTVDAQGNVTQGAPSNCSAATDIVNPYYSMSPQGTLDANGWYPAATFLFQPGVNTSPGYYDTPWVSNLILNWRKNKLSITPSLQFSMGTSYGSPYDVQGLDPRFCGANSANSGITSGNPQNCNYLTLTGVTANPVPGFLYIPNPQTGSFATLGAFREPSILTGNLQVSYDVSPRVTLQATLSNVFHTCFGGTKAAWTSAYPAGQAVCGYGANVNYIGNYQNGAGQNTPANAGSYVASDNGGVSPYPWQFQSYRPLPGSPAANGPAGAGLPLPFNAYFQVNIKL